MNLRWPISNALRMKTIGNFFFLGAYRVNIRDREVENTDPLKSSFDFCRNEYGQLNIRGREVENTDPLKSSFCFFKK